jgi:integrase
MKGRTGKTGSRVIGKLSTIEVARAQRRGLYGDGGGLFLQVSVTGTKAWIFRWKEDGRHHNMGLGPLHTVSLADARDKALECRKARLDGRDPIAERQAQRMALRIERAKAVTFAECATRYIAAHKAGWRNAKHAAQWTATLVTYAFPVFGDLPVQAVDLGLVLKAVEPIWTTKPETASRLRGRIESVLGWATTRGYRAGDNPARWKDHLANLLPARGKVARVEHHAALPYGEIAAFVAELRRQEGIAAKALEFTILTAARTGEVIGARWDEIDLAKRLWVVPGSRMKAGREHRVPLGSRALAILEELPKVNDFVFPGARSGGLGQMSLLQVLHRMGRADLTVHGFRSCFSDWCAERTAFPSELREMALAHAIGNKVEASYRRGDLFDKRRQLAEAWGRFCAAPATGGGEVVPLRAVE